MRLVKALVWFLALGLGPSLFPAWQAAVDNPQLGKLVPFQENGKWGYRDRAGQVVIQPQFLIARKFSEGFAAVLVEAGAPGKIGFIDGRGIRTAARVPKKWGFLNTAGNVVIDPQFEAVGDFSEGLAAASYAIPFSDIDSWGYIDKEGTMVIRPQFSRAQRFSGGLALVWAGGVPLEDAFVKSFVKMGYIDKSGLWVIHSSFQYFFYDDFSDGLVPFRKNFGKWGYMDEAGKVAIKPQFDWAGRFTGGMAPVLIGGTCSQVDKAGTIVTQPQPQKAADSSTRRRRRVERDRHGTFIINPMEPPCS